MHWTPSRRLIAVCVFASAAMLCAQPAFAQPTVHFELRLAPGQDDAVLTMGDPTDDTLEIEVWAEIMGSNPGSLFKSYALFLRVDQDGIISTSQADYSSPLFEGAIGCLFNPPPNDPQVGDLSTICIGDGNGTSEGFGAPTLIATYVVRAENLGATSYSWSPTGGSPFQWGAAIYDESAPIPTITLDDSDCTDGTCNVTGSIASELAIIEVVDAPPVPRSPDADDDGDADMADFALMQGCVGAGGVPSVACLRVDLDFSQSVDAVDAALWVNEITGVLPPFGDVDGDFDVDLADFARYQLCRGPDGDNGIEELCTLVDVDRNGIEDPADLAKLVERLVGPN